jgi:hypothetical protein
MIKSPRKLPTVCILYGLAEGPAHSRILRQLLEHIGFRITKNAYEADILLAHSGGYFLIPANNHDKLILLIGPCNGYRGRSMFLTQIKKVLVDLDYSVKHRLFMLWLYKSFWHAIYLAYKQRTNSVMYRGSRRLGKVLPKLNPKLLSVILYRNDPWSWHGNRDELLKLEQACLISHSGLHDDLWMHPEQYVAILQYLYETRVLAGSNQR